MKQLPFRDRVEAGRALAAEVSRNVHDPSVVVEALPRGGVVVGYEVARALRVPMDVIIVRKLGVPGQEELAFGAIAGRGQRFIDHSLTDSIPLTQAEIQQVVKQQERELKRREDLYRGSRQPIPLAGREVILVDDGMATGSTMLVAIQAVRQLGAKRILVAVPVASAGACELCRAEGAKCLSLATPENFRAVAEWYEDFTQVSDSQVCNLLAAQQRGSGEPR